MDNNLLSSGQIRAALSLLQMDNGELAKEAGVSVDTVLNIKMEHHVPQARVRAKIKNALEARGIEFLPDDGIRRRFGTIDRFVGEDALAKFFDDVYDTVKDGGELRVSGVDERKFAQFNTPENATRHRDRMAKIKDKISFQVLLQEGDTYFRNNTYIQYRWIPKEFFFPHPIYLYNEKLAFIRFENNNLEILRISLPLMAAAFRMEFDFMWQHSITPTVVEEK